MPAPKQQYAASDEHKVNLADEKEVAYWTHFFECTELELREAIAVMGTSLPDVWYGIQLLHSAT